MSSSATAIWDTISDHIATISEQAGKAVVAVDAGHRVAASGVYWKPGVVVTASHLVRRANEASVIFPTGATTQGTVAGRDSTTDIAVVRVAENAGLATLTSNSNVKLGELVLAVARSGRGELATATGIIARTGAAWRTWRGGQVDRLIRPDIRLYPGQSGSALINGRGELLGINTAVLARASVITLPVETVDRVVTELLERGHIAQPYLGVALQEVPLPEDWRAAAAPGQEHGMLVMHVVSDGPAQRAGVNLGDVIVAVQGEAVQSFRELQGLLAQKRTGETLQLRVLRSGTAVEARVTLGDRPRR